MKSNVIPLFGNSKSAVVEQAGVEHLSHQKAQISLPFAATHTLFLAMAADFERPLIFQNFLSRLHVSEILDMRIAPRLDFVGQTRPQAFHIFEDLDISYRDMLGRVGVKTYDLDESTQASLWDALNRTLADIEIRSEPILLIFDSSAFLGICRRYLNSLYEAVSIDAAKVRFLTEDDDLMRM